MNHFCSVRKRSYYKYFNIVTVIFQIEVWGHSKKLHQCSSIHTTETHLDTTKSKNYALVVAIIKVTLLLINKPGTNK